MKKSVSFLYTKNKVAEREIKKNNPIWNCFKRIKYLGINVTKEVTNLYSENYKTLMKETEHNKTQWKDIPCS